MFAPVYFVRLSPLLPSFFAVVQNSSTRSFPICNDLEMRHLFGRYRLLYTSFVRCMKYLNRLQDDALNGRTPSVPADSDRGDIYPYSKNSSLKAYFAKARRLVRGSRRSPGSQSSSDAALSLTTDSIGSSAEEQKREESAAQLAAVNPSGVKARAGAGGGRRLGRSMITDRLLRPTLAGDVADVNLPWSCAIYSVVNWMVAFADVEGIQVGLMFWKENRASPFRTGLLTPFMHPYGIYR